MILFVVGTSVDKKNEKKMQIVIIKLVQFWCIVLLFQRIKCEIRMLKDAIDDQQMENIAACTANCMQSNATVVKYQLNTK